MKRWHGSNCLRRVCAPDKPPSRRNRTGSQLAARSREGTFSGCLASNERAGERPPVPRCQEARGEGQKRDSTRR